ncbi:MAG: transcription-repair coupling factor [Bacteroidales bacterium]|jgi:transcription-repair coupling factor (superfamily II helicase)|nr:transcription-repair coupling factor [Bacteroidales bacterium]
MTKEENVFCQYDGIQSFVIEATKSHSHLAVEGLRGTAFAFFAGKVARETTAFDHVIICEDYNQAAACYNDMIFNGFPVFFGNLTEAEALSNLKQHSSNVMITYNEMLFRDIASEIAVGKNTVSLSQGQILDLDFFIELLDSLHFERTDFVYEAGNYALRGGIVDVFSYSERLPLRIEFSGDKIESMRTFDVVSQLSNEELKHCNIVPDVQNDELFATKSTIIDWYVGKNVIIWLNTKPKEDKATTDVWSKIFKHNNIYVNQGKENLQTFTYNCEMQPVFNQSFEVLNDNLVSHYENGYQLFVSVADMKQKERLESVFRQGDRLKVNFIDFSFASGFIDHDRRLLLYTDHQIFARHKNFKVRNDAANREMLAVEDLTTLRIGDYVTHIDYGVGRFGGLEKIEGINGKLQESIRLIYKDNDVLYVSIHALHKVSRYTGGEGSVPKISRLGSKAWAALKEKTKGKVKDIARELILLYAKRKQTQGFSFSADNYLQNALEASFLYEDTPDQHKASVNVKKDMENSYPMDRLVCGDVGFGKTEIAIRAAFKAACDNKQTAVLVPTTILALLHFKTFSERLKGLPVRVEYLSRFRSTKEKNEIIKNLQSGKIDIIIGTHTLVWGKSKSESIFKDLGLLIIDEEHKFGVSVKEKLRKIKVNVDTLALSATPIPRTLQFSLMGARDLSIINTPPLNRLPVQTKLSAFDKDLIKQAIEYELSRNGQVFFVNDRIIGLEQLRQVVLEQVPDARVQIAHSQLPDDELERIMLAFIDGEFDVLISTTIVENGLDVSNANTIIINHANNYGLSDLHQLRGRVGRTNRAAFCYLLVDDEKILTEQAEKRLKAVEEFTALGSGFAIAMRDLDIRGAGNILGQEQSGFINEMGFETYNKILNEAIAELRTEIIATVPEQEKNYPQFEVDCTIETDFEALIPDSYIGNMTERLKIYKYLDSITEEQELQRLKTELTDRFGKVPKETLLLFDIVRLRQKAKSLSIEKLIMKNNRLIIHFVAASNTNFYNSEKFQSFLILAQSYPQSCKLKEENDRLIATFLNINTIQQTNSILNF